MRLGKTATRIGMVFCAVMVLFGNPQNIFAAQAPAYEPITNEATVTYTIDGTTRDQTGSVTFKVDNRVDLRIAAPAQDIEVLPGDKGIVMTFTVRNDGNAYQDYALSVSNVAGNDFDLYESDYSIYVESGDDENYGTNDKNLDRDFIDELAPGDTCNVYVVADIPVAYNGTDLANGHTSTIELTAITRHAASEREWVDHGDLGGEISEGGENTLDGVEVVFADADNDGQETAQGTFKVVDALLQVQKSAEVISDPVSELDPTDPPPKAIPGATILYTINVTNNGSKEATNVIISDIIPDYCTYVDGSMILGDVPNAVQQTDEDDAAANVDNAKVIKSGETVTGIEVTGFNNLSAGSSLPTLTFKVKIDAE